MNVIEGKHVPFFKPDAVKALIELVSPPTALYTCHRASSTPDIDVLMVISTRRNRSVSIRVTDTRVELGLIGDGPIRPSNFLLEEIFQAAQKCTYWLEGNG